MYTFIESLKLALSSIRAHKLRSFLTLLGVIFGVMTVVAVASVIEGANKYISEKIADQGANTLTIQKFGLITSFEEFLDANRRNKDLTLEDVTYLRQNMTLAQFIGADGQSNTEVKAGNEKLANVSVKGVTASMANIDTVQAESGRYVRPLLCDRIQCLLLSAKTQASDSKRLHQLAECRDECADGQSPLRPPKSRERQWPCIPRL